MNNWSRCVCVDTAVVILWSSTDHKYSEMKLLQNDICSMAMKLHKKQGVCDEHLFPPADSHREKCMEVAKQLRLQHMVHSSGNSFIVVKTPDEVSWGLGGGGGGGGGSPFILHSSSTMWTYTHTAQLVQILGYLVLMNIK